MTTKRECHCEERSDEAISPLRGNRRFSQCIEQRLGLFEIGGVEAFGEPAIDRCQQIAGFGGSALPAHQIRETSTRPQFPGFRLLLARCFHRTSVALLCPILFGDGRRQQQITLYPMQFRHPPFLAFYCSCLSNGRQSLRDLAGAPVPICQQGEVLGAACLGSGRAILSESLRELDERAPTVP